MDMPPRQTHCQQIQMTLLKGRECLFGQLFHSKFYQIPDHSFLHFQLPNKYVIFKKHVIGLPAMGHSAEFQFPVQPPPSRLGGELDRLKRLRPPVSELVGYAPLSASLAVVPRLWQVWCNSQGQASQLRSKALPKKGNSTEFTLIQCIVPRENLQESVG